MKPMIAALLICTSLSGFTQTALKKFTIHGDASKLKEPISWVYISYPVGVDEWKRDSAKVTSNGLYRLSGEIAEPALIRLWPAFRDASSARKLVNKRDNATLFLEPSSITIHNVDSFSNATVSGSVTHDVYLELREKLKSVIAKDEALNREYARLSRMGQKEAMKNMEPQFDEVSAA